MRLALNALDPDSYFDVAPGQLSSDGGPYRLIINDLLRDWSILSYEAGDEDDTIIYDSNHSYTSELLSFASGGGNDKLYIGRFYVGSVAVSAGAGDDVVILAHIEGSSGGYVDAGEGDDLIRVRASFGAVGMFGNSVFDIIAGSGNDLVELEGIQFNLLGAAINTVDGGAGFDSFAWNLSYDLGHGTDQTGIDATNPPLLREIGISNFEELIVSAPRVGSSLRLTAADVALITQSSLFDRSELGLGLSGTGNTLFIRSVGLPVALDLSGWSLIGQTNRGGIVYDLFGDGDALLAVEQGMFTATEPPRELWIDQLLGGSIRVDDLLSTNEPVVTWRLTDQAGNEVDYYHWDPVRRAVVIDDWPEGLPELNLRLEAHFSDGSVRTRDLLLRASDLSFTSVEAGSEFLNVAIGDVNGDGLLEPFGTFRQEDGSFLTMDVDAHGLGVIFAEDRVDRDHRLVDLDNDGDLDLIATTYALSTPGPNIAYMFSNDGQGYFTEIASFTALGVQGFGETIVAADFDNDGLTDLYLPYYFRDDTLPGGITSPVAGSRFFLNQGGMAFSDATEAWDIVNDDGSLSLKGFGSFYEFMPEGAHALDINSDGLIDLFVAGHLFLNLGGSFYDANTALGLPTDFEEGALFFDWNNDGYFDYLAVPPHEGPILFQFNPALSRFEQVFAFPSGLVYNEVYGIQAGDLNGDGWQDVVVGRGHGVPRIFLNDGGQSYVEYRSLSTELFNGFAPVVGDLTGDGQPDLIVGDGGGIFANSSTEPGHVVTVTLLGPNGEMNQHGRVVKLEPIDPADTRILTRAVDSGSGYMAQGSYEIQFTDSAANAYRAHAHIIDYATGAPIVVTFVATSGHAYVVRAPSGSQAAQVSDAATGEPVEFTWAFSFAVNQAPIFDVPDETVTFVEGDDPVQPFSSVSVRDLNSSNYDGGSLTVSLSGGGQQGDRLTLSLSDQAGTGLEVELGVVRYNGQIIGTIASSDTEMTIELNQLADNAAVQGLVEAVRFATASDDPGSGDRTVSVRLSDGGGTANAGEDSTEFERTFAVTPVNDAPTVAIVATPGALPATEQVALDLKGMIAVADPDANPADVTVALSVDYGIITVDPGASGVIVSDSGTSSVTLTGTLAEINDLLGANAIGAVTFTANTDNPPASAELSVSINDNGQSGVGGALTDTETANIAIVPINDAPINTVPGSQLINEDASFTLSTGNGNAISVADIDATTLTVTLTVLHGTLTLAGTADLTFSGGSDGTADEAMTFSGTAAAINAALGSGLTYNPNADFNGSDAIAVFTTDNGQLGGPAQTDSDSVTINITAVGDAPVAQPDAFTITESGTIAGGNLFADHGSGADAAGDGPPLSISAVGGGPSANVGSQFQLDSGALLTVRADGTFDYNPNTAYLPTPTAGSGASNTPGHDSFTYTLAGGNAATVSITLTGLDTDDTLLGTAGVDLLFAGVGNDYLDGGAGADQMSGQAGNDVYAVDNANDLVFENAGEGNDIVYLEVSYTLGAGQAVETLAARDNSLTTALNLTGNELANTVLGNGGANFIDGGAGVDMLAGNGGDDVYAVDNGADLVFEGAGGGNDIVYTSASYTLGTGQAVETLAARDNSLTTALALIGNELANTVLGNSGANFIDGNGGADVLAGYGGNDVYAVDNAADQVVEGAGGGNDIVYTSASYTLGAGQAVETLAARDNSLTTALSLTGNELANTILGNSGSNAIDGGGAADVLVGYGGSDTFSFTTALGGGNVDHIVDFASGSDKIALDDAVFTGLGLGSLSASAFVTGTAAQDADDRIIYNSATGQLYFDADGNGAGAAILFATLQGAPVLGASDLVVI